MIYKFRDLLYKNSKKENIRLAGAKVCSLAPTGIYSSCRAEGEKVTAAAKLSNVALILDMMILDHKVVARQSDDKIYTKFEYMGSLYEGMLDKTSFTMKWLSKSPSGYPLLIPCVAYVLSDSFTGDNANEMKGYFEAIKKDKDKDSVFLFCDAFFHGFAKDQGQISVEPGVLPREEIDRALATGALKEIELLKGLESGIDMKAVAVAEEEDEKEEDYHINYEWNEEQKANIPGQDSLSQYVMTDDTKAIARKVKYRLDKVLGRMEKGITGNQAIENDYVNLLMVGRPGTGKTSLANAVAGLTGMPIYTIPFSKHTEEDTVEGKNKVVDGKIGFVETDLLKAYQNGGIIVCEEINLADPSVVMGSLGQAMEKPFIVMKDGYIPVHRHPLCVIIGTMNTGTAGSKQLNQALSSRFKNTYVLDDPDKNTFIKILQSKGYLGKTCRYIYDAYTKIMNYLKDPSQSHEDLTENITLRACFGALESMEEGQTAKEAIKCSIVGKIAEVDLEVAREVDNHVVSGLPDRF